MSDDSQTAQDDATAERTPALAADDDAPPFLVAAVGASAGGLEAFTALIRELPAGAPLALVLVQHMARDQQSLLPEIIARRTALRVMQAEEELRIEPATIYVIPAGAYMTVTDGHLRLRPRPAGRGSEQVDVLFRSLAVHFRERAVGIVLSGSAADGAAGLREIKAAGGITIAQAPNDARIDSMPKAAIATGAVDMVLPVESMGAELLRLASLPLFRQPLSVEPPAEDNEDRLKTVFRLLRRATGIDFDYYKRPTILRRISRRMALRSVSQLDDYVTLLQDDALEIQNLSEDLLIHVTSFFREPESFAALADKVLPQLLAAGPESIRIWVPGCSTGEEVYSLAIVLFEALGDDIHSVPLQIFGTDVSSKAVEAARLGLYPETIAADVGAERLRRFFVRVDGGYRITKAVRECCVFARQDITRDPPFSKLDLIVCRNMLIYLGQAIQRKVMAVLNYALKPSGFLMLGRAESTGPNTSLFSIADKKFRIYSKKNTVNPKVDLDFQLSLPNATPTLSKRPASLTASGWDVQSEADRLLITRYVPPSIVVDASFQILAVRGHTSDFLELPSGDVSLDVLKMVRVSLLVALRSALEEAQKTRLPARRQGLTLVTTREARTVDLEVSPLGTNQRPSYLVLFDDGNRNAAQAAESPAQAAESPPPNTGSEADSLRLELANTREQLRANIHDLAAANEELQSANEEILSSNEELQSTNEELDTAKEELQSTNEELSTLNDELRVRNEELMVANSDLSNLLAGVQIPILMVTEDLRIRRFTPAAERVLNLIPSDAGRPIGHINPNINCSDLEAQIAEVIQTVTAREEDVEGRDGRRYSLRIRPYKSVENRIDGAVLTLVDVSSARDALVATQKTCEAVMASVRDPIALLSAELKVTGVNKAFASLFAISDTEIVGRPLFSIRDLVWENAELRQLLERTAAGERALHDFVVERAGTDGAKKRFSVDVSPVEPGKPGSLLILVLRQEFGHGAL